MKITNKSLLGITLTICLGSFLALQIAVPVSAQEKFTIGQILKAIAAVKAGNTTFNKIIGDVERRGVSFQLTEANEQLLRDEGATSELIKAIRQNSLPIPKPPPPTPKPLNESDFIERAKVNVKNGQFEQAIENYSKAIEINPRSEIALIGRAEVLSRVSKTRESALVDFTKAIAVNSSAENYIRRGFVYKLQNKNDLAFADFTKAIQLDPRNSGGYCNRGHLAVEMNNIAYEQALGDLNKCVEIKPNDWSYAYRAELQNKFKKYDSAISDYTKSLELNPDDKYRYRHRGLGDAYLGKEKYDLAIAEYTKGITSMSGTPYTDSYYISRGKVYFENKKGKDALAIADYTKAIEISPEYSYPYALRGMVYLYLKQYNTALADLSKAIDLDSKTSWYYESRSEVYKKLNQKSLADADLQKAKELNNRK